MKNKKLKLLFLCFIALASCKKEERQPDQILTEDDLGWVYYKPKRSNDQIDTLYYLVNKKDTAIAVVESKFREQINYMDKYDQKIQDAYVDTYIKYMNSTIYINGNPISRVNNKLEGLEFLINSSIKQNNDFVYGKVKIFDESTNTIIPQMDVLNNSYNSVYYCSFEVQDTFDIVGFYFAKHYGPIKIVTKNNLVFELIK